MPQTILDVSRIKARDASTAIDRLAEIVQGQGITYWGASDGADTGTGSFSGTDNTVGFQAALNLASSRHVPLYVPSGTYRFNGVTVNNTAVITLPSYCWIIAHGATFLVDEDVSITTMSLRDFMRSAGWEMSYERDLYEMCRIEGLTFQGRWSHAPLTDSTNPSAKGLHFLSVANYKEFVLDGVRAFDCRGQFGRPFSCETTVIKNCHFERISSDCIRAGDCPNLLIDGNYVKNTGDNSIAAHSFVTRPGAVTLGTPNPNRPPRANVIVTNNRLENCVVPAFLGAHTLVFANNILQRCHGSVAIGLQITPEGASSQCNISVTGNIIEDCLQRYTGGGTFAGQIKSQAALMLGGAPMTIDSSPVFVGEYDPATQSVLSPWGNGSPDPVWGYLWSALSKPASGSPPQHSSAGAYNINVMDNHVVRTLPPVAHFSDWGFGEFFVNTGYEDPAIPDSAFRITGISLTADIRNFIVANNIVMGFRAGPGIYLNVGGDEEMLDQPWRGGVIKGNIVHDCGQGLSTHHAPDIVSPTLNSDLLIEGNIFDIDPYHKSEFRTVPIDGSWPNSSASADFPLGVNVQGYKGWTIRGNTFQNVYIPIGPTLPVAFANAHIENNLLYCDPVAAGWNVGNKGIANIPQPGAAFRHMIVDGNPTSPTWRALKNTCPQSANVQPSAGTWVEGQVVTNLTPTIVAGKILIAWIRLTTGSGNVAGTDWSPLYCTIT